MNLGDYIKQEIEKQGRTQKWVAEEMNIDRKTFNRKLKTDYFTAQELLQVGKILNLDLNKLKESV